MADVHLSEDCGNSPKNQFVADLTVALAQADIQYLLSKVTEDFRWHKTGAESLRGKEQFAAMLEGLKKERVAELTILHALTHGRAGAVNGIKKLSGGKSVAFCLVFDFDGARAAAVREITAYEIALG